jgi:hypothetical protein
MRETSWGRRGRWLRSAVVPGVLLAVVSACSDGGDHGTGPQVEDAELVMAANVAGTTIATLVVRVTAPDLPAVLVFNLAIGEEGFAFGTIKVPPGNDRLITVQAFDDMGLITHEGAALVNVQPGNNPPVFIALVPRAGQVPLEIMMGDIFVNVFGPNVGSPGQTLQLDAVIFGPLGEVSGGEIEWASDNPAIATVDQTGLVSLLLAGTVRIYGVSAGYSGFVEITVLPSGTGIVNGNVFNMVTGMPLEMGDVFVDDIYVASLDATGSFSFQYPAGTYTISVFLWGNPECTPPASQELIVPDGGSAFVSFVVDCNAAPSNNETGLPEEADYCIVLPPAINALEGEVVNFYGQVFEAGWTEDPGPNPMILAQFGFGLIMTDPTVDGTWQWGTGSFNVDVGNNDEYMISLVTDGLAGQQYAYAFRVSLNGGASWTYCDADGAGSNTDLDFSSAAVGVLNVN